MTGCKNGYLVLDMLSQQKTFNDLVASDWLQRRFDWHRAIWTECSELSGHLGWEWWKSADADVDQARLELVDIWAFGMSLLLDQRGGKLDDNFVDVICAGLSSPRFSDHKANLLSAVDILAAESAKGIFLPSAFSTVMHGLSMSVDDLHFWYVGKNTLNRFRQDNGYKAGVYQKIWNGKEDNQQLTEILALSCDESMSRSDWIYKNLDERYRRYC